MSTKTSAKHFFMSWVGTLDATKLNVTDKKLTNILIKHFDTLVQLGTAAGKRAAKLGELIEKEADQTSSDLPNIDAVTDHQEKRVRHLAEIKIGPFRGFSSPEVFRFKKKYTFLYGPNGSGKSSFCEALEYSLLGEIEEADAKKISLANYLKNAQRKSFSTPELSVRLFDDTVTPFSAPNLSYRFCFIEKNRIDSFARISATSPKDQLQRISSLFGLDSYNEYVNGFTNDFNDRYIKLKDGSAERIEKENLKLSASKLRLQDLKKAQEKVVEDAKALSKQLLPLEFSGLKDLKIYLSGEDGTKGRIAELQAIKAKTIAPDIDQNVVKAAIQRREDIDKVLTELDSLLLNIASLSAQVGYRDLYLSIKSLHEAGACGLDQCPACHTPLANVVSNPFELAFQELAKMESLAALQDRIKANKSAFMQAIRDQNTALTAVNKLKNVLAVDIDFRALTEITLQEVDQIPSWRGRLAQEIVRLDSSLGAISQLESAIAAKNLALANERSEQKRLVNELDKYTKIKDTADELSARNKLLKEEAEKNQAESKTFADSIQLIIDGSKEARRKVAENLEFQRSYYTLTSKLREDCEILGAVLARGLAARAIEFYNTINGFDPDFEKLHALKIPTASGEKIMIQFRGDPASYDALHIMSEGHLKCLGLSLLLSKVVADDLGFIVYDDIVNAIDDNHRDGIAALMLENEWLRDRQQIVTCHGEIFINKLNQKLGIAKVNELVTEYRFIPVDRVEERGVKIMEGDSLHHLAQADAHANKNELKNSAAKCRQAIEGISEKLWRKLSKHLSISLSVKLRKPGGQPDLDSVVTALIKELKLIKFELDDNIASSMGELKDQYNWALLNKGTHEDGSIPEFDRADILNLITLLKKIDGQCSSLKMQIKA
jgi:energy-coupling factor transporter ATP-binding protein EcfA2